MLTIHNDGQHFAVVGLALSLEPGTYTLDDVERQLTFEVIPKKYLEQRIYLKNERHVTPNTLDLDRIKNESQKQRGALNAFDGNLDAIHMIFTMEGPISDHSVNVVFLMINPADHIRELTLRLQLGHRSRQQQPVRLVLSATSLTVDSW